MVDSTHGKEVTFTIRSAPVGYAAEYLTRGSFAPRIAPASRLGQRPRGICDSHGLSIAHVYLLHIIPLSPSTRSTCSTRLTIPHSSLFVYLVYFVVQISASFAFFAAKTFYTIYTAIKFIQHSIVTLWHSIHRSFCCLAAPPCQPLPSGR